MLPACPASVGACIYCRESADGFRWQISLPETFFCLLGWEECSSTFAKTRGGSKQNSACYSATLLLTFFSLLQRWLASFQILRFAVLSLSWTSPTRLFHSAGGWPWRGLGGFTVPRQLSFDCSRLLLASCFQEEQSESVLCVECVRTEGVFKPAKCMRGEGCLPESESRFASALFRLQVSSPNGPDYLRPYRTSLCHVWTNGHICSPHIWDYRIRFSKLILKMIFFFKFAFSILQEACWAVVCLYRLVIVFAHSQWMARNYLITRKAASRISL